MRQLLLHVIFALLFSNALYAAGNACQMDIYFANGMMGNDKKTEEAIWDLYVQELKKTNPILNTRTLNARVAYNASELGGLGDVYEVLFQRIVGNTISWLKLQDMFIKYVDDNDLIEVYNRLSQVFNYEDLATQIQSYRQSIYNGHGVIVVAHSQGNFFTNKSFEYLDDWMTSHFYMIGVASPSTVVVNGGPRISFDNDPVPIISFAPWTIRNENRSRLERGSLDLPSLKFHGFNYYMGESVTVSDLGKTKRVSTFVAKEAIGYGILGAIENYAQCFCPEKDSEDLVAKRGVVEVGLSWLYPQVNMDLTFSLGTKDVSDVKGWTYEHYYVDEESVEPGVYPVSVSGSYGLPTECTQDFEIDEQAPEIIGISIATPGDSAFFILEARSPEEFNIGNVADVFICEKGSEDCPEDGIEIIPELEKGEAKITTVCHGDCKQIFVEANSTTLDYLFKVIPKLSQGLLGPLGGANINVFRAKEYSNAIEALFTGATTSGSSIYTTGLINIPNVFVEQLEDEVYYVVEIEGGSDIDANDDMKVDEVATTNNGTLHALLTGKEIKAKGFKVNILTEAAYQVSKHLLDANNTTALSEQLDNVALRLLKDDINRDGFINKVDLYKWIPSSDKSKLYANYDSRIHSIVLKIYANQEIYNDAYDLIYKPYFITDNLSADENITINTSIGAIDIESAYDTNVSITLDGIDGHYFTIDSDGKIYFVPDAIVDYEIRPLYKITLITENSFGNYSKDITIFIQNIPETAPVLHDLNISISDGTAIGPKIGNILVSSGDTPIKSYTLSEESPFGVRDYNGDVYVDDWILGKEGMYSLQVYAENTFGQSNMITLNVHIEKNRTIGYIETLGSAISATLSEDETKIYIGDSRSGFKIVDISDVITPVVLGSNDTLYAGNILVSADETIAYITDIEMMHTVDISDVTSPTILGTVNIPKYVYKTVLSADERKVYIGGLNVGLQIIDVNNLSMPSMLGTSLSEMSSEQIILSSDGTKAYVIADGLNIIDIGNSSTPKIIGKIEDSGYMHNMVVSADEKKLYVADINNSLQIIDISDATAPSILGEVEVIGAASRVVVSIDGAKAYVMADGLNIIDVNDPSAPKIIGSVEVSGFALDIILSSDEMKAYVIHRNKFSIIDISDSANPIVIKSIEIPARFLYEIILSSDKTKAFITSVNGVYIIDLVGL